MYLGTLHMKACTVNLGRISFRNLCSEHTFWEMLPCNMTALICFPIKLPIIRDKEDKGEWGQCHFNTFSINNIIKCNEYLTCKTFAK